MKRENKSYLKKFLQIAPLSHALWRSVEALSYSQVKLEKPILDLGCGFGEFSGVVFDRLETGIDINKKELEKALEGGKYKKVKWADARKLPFKDKSYKTVVSNSVLEHIDNVQDVVKEVNRILEKKGIFVFTVPTTKIKTNLLLYKLLKSVGLNNLANIYFDYHKKAFKHVSLKSPNWWKNTLEKNGFEIMILEGTISNTVLWLHEIFLITAFPSQLWKSMFGKRLLVTTGLRSNILPPIFNRFIKIDKKNKVNLFIVARKK